MSAEPFSQPLTRERRTQPRGSIWPGFLVAAALAGGAGVLLALYGPTYAGDPTDSTRQVSGGWSHAGFYALTVAAIAGLVLHFWSDRVRRAPIGLVPALLLVAVSLAAVGGGMVFLDGKLHRHYVAVPLEKAKRYYAWALEKDYSDYRQEVARGRFDLALWRPGDTKMVEGRRRVAAARTAVTRFKALDEQRIRESRWLVSHGGLVGPAKAEALADFDKRFTRVRLLQRKRWLSQEGLYASTEDLIDLLQGVHLLTQQTVDRWNQNAASINQANAEEFSTLCVISRIVVDHCVFTDDKRPKRPD